MGSCCRSSRVGDIILCQSGPCVRIVGPRSRGFRIWNQDPLEGLTRDQIGLCGVLQRGVSLLFALSTRSIGTNGYPSLPAYSDSFCARLLWIIDTDI